MLRFGTTLSMDEDPTIKAKGLETKVTFYNELRAPNFGVSSDAPHPLMEGNSNSGVMEPLRADLRESVNTVPSGGCEIDPSHKPVIHSSEGSIPSPTVKSLHDAAMALADEAMAAERRKDFFAAMYLYHDAWKKERDAWVLADRLNADDITRTVLKESAGYLYQNMNDALNKHRNGGIKVMPSVQPLENDE
jgi:hypothetical protein